MLQQGIIQIGDSYSFIDKHSDKCIDGDKCDTNGCGYYEIKGKRYRERDFKQYRKYSPQFRHECIMNYFWDTYGEYPTMQSSSCSKCGTVAIDERWWVH